MAFAAQRVLANDPGTRKVSSNLLLRPWITGVSRVPSTHFDAGGEPPKLESGGITQRREVDVDRGPAASLKELRVRCRSL